ncbi:uncharacterized protein METZ01_LOCUS82398 [marine metagenome]|uniref:Uncharacterized protein n=1 Tax=marine metagenome TaxID=408172 RepID=A0A381UNJ0_9ZZZZ
MILRLAKLKFKQVASPLAKLRSGAGRRSVDGLERILLDEVAVINQRPVLGVLNVAQLVDGAHGFALFALDVSCQGLDGIEHHLVGANFTEVLNPVLGILSQCGKSRSTMASFSLAKRLSRREIRLPNRLPPVRESFSKPIEPVFSVFSGGMSVVTVKPLPRFSTTASVVP